MLLKAVSVVSIGLTVSLQHCSWCVWQQLCSRSVTSSGEDAVAQGWTVSAVVFAQHRTDVLKKGYKILKDSADDTRAITTVWPVLNQREASDSTSLKYLKYFMLSNSAVDDALQETSTRCLWNIIFNESKTSIDKRDRDWEIARHKSTNHLLTSYMENGESLVKFAKRRTAVDMREGIFGAVMA